MKKRNLFLSGMLMMALVFGMSVLVIGCGQKGGTVTFINDERYYSANAGIAVSTGGTPNAPVLKSVGYEKKISESLDEDGYYIFSLTQSADGRTYGPYVRSGRLTGGETVTIKASEF